MKKAILTGVRNWTDEPETKHDCSKCPADVKAECDLVNKEKIDNFVAMTSKIKELILKSSEPISIHGDRDAYHYFNELKAFIQAQLDFIKTFDTVTKEDIEMSDRLAKEAYDKEMEFIEFVKYEVDQISREAN